MLTGETADRLVDSSTERRIGYGSWRRFGY